MNGRLRLIPALMATAILSWTTGGLAGEAAPDPAPVPASKAVRPAGVPAEAAVWVVATSPKATLERLKKLVDSFQPGTGGMLEMLIRQGSPWYFEEADETKPVVAICQLPKADDDEPVWAIVGSLKEGSDGAVALEKRFGGKPAKVEDGLSVFLQVQEGALPDKEVFAAVKDGRVTVGGSKELVRMLSACPAPAEGAYPAGVDMLGGADVKALAAQYKDDIEEALKEFEEELAGEAGPELATELGLEANGEKLGAAMAGLFVGPARAALREVELAGCQIRLGDSVSVALAFKAAPGGAFAAWLAEAEKGRLPNAKELPEGGIMSMAAAIPPERLARLFEEAGKPFGEALAGDEKLKKSFDDIFLPMNAYFKATDGTGVMTLARRAGGLCQASCGGMKDPAAARESMVRMMKFVESGPLADLLTKAGLKYVLAEKVREVEGLPVDRLTMDMKPPADPNMPVELQDMQRKMFDKLYGMPMVQEWAFSKDRVMMAGGKESGKVLDELAARAAGKAPGTAAMAGTVAAAPKGTFVAGEMYVVGYAKLIMDMTSEAVGAMMPMPKLEIPADAEKTPVTGYFTAAGGELGAELRVPVEPIKKLVDAFKKMQQDMMQNLQNQPAVPLIEPDVDDVEVE